VGIEINGGNLILHHLFQPQIIWAHLGGASEQKLTMSQCEVIHTSSCAFHLLVQMDTNGGKKKFPSLFTTLILYYKVISGVGSASQLE